MATTGKARKRGSQDDGGAHKRRKSARQDESLLDVDAGLNEAFARMDSQLLADYVAQKTSRFGKELSPVELADLYISGG